MSTHGESSGSNQGSSSQQGSGGSNQGSGSGSRSIRGPANLLGTVQGDLYSANYSKKGSSGTPSDCQTNFIPIEINSEAIIYQYHVQFEPAVDSKSFRQLILQDDAIAAEIGINFIFDGMILYLAHNWKRGQQDAVIQATHPGTGELVNVKFHQNVRFSRNDGQAINCYNIIIRRCFDQIGFKQMGRYYFNPTKASRIDNYGLEVWPGYETAIRLYDDGLMLCIENRFKILRMDNIQQIIRTEEQRCGNRERMRNKMEEMYTGQSITTHYNNKMHRLTRFDWNLSPLSTFTKADGTETTLLDYYKSQYKIDIEFMDQPIIISEGKPKQPDEPPQVSYLIPELCQPTGLTDDMRDDKRVMRALSSHTRLDPNRRYKETMTLLERLRTMDSCRSLLEHWKIDLADNLANINARVLPDQKLIGGLGAFTGTKAEWARECKRAGNFRSVQMSDWVVVCQNKQEYSSIVQKFIQEIQGVGTALKMNVTQPNAAFVQGNDINDFIIAIKQACQQYPSALILVVILPDDNKTRYDAVKKWTCLEAPVPTQCVLIKTLAGKPNDGGSNKNFSSIVLKIILQMNCKMGGALWKINIPMKDAMIVGYDLYNDSTSRGKTIGAAVSTIDSDYTRFYSQTRPHGEPTELGTNLTFFIRKALNRWYTNNNKTLPSRLFLYRDGAGDGQIPHIRDQEVALVLKACKDVCDKAGLPNHKIRLAFYVVIKKCNMRVFRKVPGGHANPEPGTIIDNTVTRPDRNDFYLIPQFVNQGTVTPVSYQILHDDTDFTADKHHMLAFKLCHMYYNWQGTVRVPAPCQYAHKLAFLVAQSVHKEAKEDLRDKLFFL